MSKRCAKEDCKRWAVKGNNVEDGGLCLQCAKEASGVKDAPSQRDLNNQIKALGIVKHGPPSDDDEPPANPWAKPGAGRGPRPADDVPIWEREAAAEKERLDADAVEEAERLRLRAESEKTYRERVLHAGKYMPWYKICGDAEGYKTEKMGEMWTCCLKEEEDAAPCGHAQNLSDLHEPCLNCGQPFLAFELPKPCRYHSGKITWREAGSAKYRYACCDRLSHEEGCISHFRHFSCPPARPKPKDVDADPWKPMSAGYGKNTS